MRNIGLMKIGSIVMYVSQDRYARWFFGRLARVERGPSVGSNGKTYCRVKWLEPVRYHDRMTATSSFPTDRFEVC